MASLSLSPAKRDPSLRSSQSCGTRQDDRAMHEGVSTGVSGLLAVQLYIHNLSRRMTGPVPDNETGEIHSAILTLVIKCGRRRRGF